MALPRPICSSLNWSALNLQVTRNGTLVFNEPYATVTTLAINGLAGADTLTVDYTGGNPIPTGGITYAAGGNAGDNLVLQDGSVNTIRHIYTNNNDGRVEVDGDTTDNGGSPEFLVNYTGLAPITDNMVVANRVFTFTAAGITGTLTRTPGGAGATQSRIDSGASEQTDFTTPTTSLTINLATGAANNFTVTDVADNYNTPTNTINLGGSGDTVNFERTDDGSVTIAPTPWDVIGGAGNDTVNLSPVARDLDNLFDNVEFQGGGGATDTFNIFDDNQAAGDTYTFTSTTIDRAGWGDESNPGATYNAAVEFINLVDTGGGADIINVTSTSATATTTIASGAGIDTYNIDASALGGNNNFSGQGNDDTFNVNLTTAALISAPLVIHGNANNFPPPVGSRDVVNINDNFGVTAALTLTYTGNVGGSELTVAGLNSLLTIDTVETVDFDGSAANDDTVTVVGTVAAADLITVAPIDANRAIVFNGGNPFDAPPEVWATSLPGVAGGSAAPDLDLSGLANTTGLNIQDNGATTGDRLYIYGESDGGLNDGNTTDPFGFGAGQILPDVNPPASFDVITVTDTATTVDNFVVVNYDAVDFVQADPENDPAIVVNSGFEPNPPATAGTDVADDINLTLSPAYRFQINGGDPDPATTGIVPPDGDRLAVTPPVGVTTINIFSDKSDPTNVTIEYVGATTLPFGYSSIENLFLDANEGTTVNLIGDDGNNPGTDQTDNFVVRGRDVDGDVSDAGYQEMEIVINGSGPIYLNNVAFLNVIGHEEVDTLELTAFADNSANPPNNAPRGWGVAVNFDEGLPNQTDGPQADLLIFHTSVGVTVPPNAFGGGSVSENIVVVPSGPDNGEIRDTNAADGSVIVIVQYTANTDIIIVDDDLSPSDTDSLFFRGTDGVTSQTSGNDTIVANFSNSGSFAPDEPVVTVTDTVSGLILYRIRNFVNFNVVTFDLLDGNDAITILGQGDGIVGDPAEPFVVSPLLESVTVFGGNGSDAFTLDNTSGQSNISGGITLHGGSGEDSLSFIGTTFVATAQYNPGPNPDEGTVRHTDLVGGVETVYFTGLEPILDIVSAFSATVFGTNSNNAINYGPGPNVAALATLTGQVSVDGFEPYEFANKSTLFINALAGSDTINLNNVIDPVTGAASIPDFLALIEVRGGDPTAGSDTVVVNGSADADPNVGGIQPDEFIVTPTAFDAATINHVLDPLGINVTLPVVNVFGTEKLIVDGRGGDDEVEVFGDGFDPANTTSDRFVHTPGLARDAGRVDLSSTTVAGPLTTVTLLSVNYQNIGIGAAVVMYGGGEGATDIDTLVILGSGGADTLNANFTAQNEINSDLTDAYGLHVDVNSEDIENYELRTLEGADLINLQAPIDATGTFNVYGGGPSGTIPAGTDALTLFGAASLPKR